MKRRLFLKAGLAAGVAGLASPSILSGAAVATRSSPARRRGGLLTIPDPPLRLQFNENPRGLSPAAKQAIIDNFEGASLYGSRPRSQLISMIAEEHGVEDSFVSMGNGSGDTLRQAPQAVGMEGMHLIACEPTYGDIFGFARRMNARITQLPPREDQSHDIPAMRRAAEEGERVLIYICQPNNPTGALTPQAEIDRWIEEADEDRVFFVVDEAYHHYVNDPSYHSADRWVHTKRNVIVARTFSKIHAMAGLRVGYGIAHPDTAGRMRALWAGGISHLTAAAAIASAEDEDWVRDSVRLNEEAKQITYRAMDELGIEYIPSQTNFMMHRITTDLSTHTGRMREQGIIVGRAFAPMTTYNRVTFGLPEDMEYFGQTLRLFREEGWI